MIRCIVLTDIKRYTSATQSIRTYPYSVTNLFFLLLSSFVSFYIYIFNVSNFCNRIKCAIKWYEMRYT